MFAFLENRQKAKELAEYGVVIGEIHAQKPHSRLLICLMKGLLVFFAAYGTLDGTLTAFSISYNRMFFLPFIFLVSMFVSFFYYNKITFYIGYISLLILFTWELIRYYMYANSGYQAIVNIIYEQYSNFFKLMSVREAKEYYTNRYVTVTVAIAFIGVFLALLLNVTISGYMNAIETALITAPILEIALYIGKKPPLLSIVMVLMTYLTVAILQCSLNSRMQVKGRHTHEFLKRKGKKSTQYNYQGSGKAIALVTASMLIISLLFVAPLINLYEKERPDSITSIGIRKTTDEYIKVFVQTGFTGLLDRYNATGGLSDGRLGGISSVRPDFETDLVVTLAPYTADTVYLKAFVGNTYTGNSWFSSTMTGDTPSSNEISFTGDGLILLEESMSKNISRENHGKMVIDNVAADSRFFYLPYYSYPGDVLVNDTTTISFSPYFKNEPTPSMLVDKNSDYQKYYLERDCLAIPEELKERLLIWCQTAKLPGVIGDFESGVEEYKSVNDWRIAVANKIHSEFVQNYPYTMSPGSTPYNTDFVDYFLFTQRRGYCAHFASSATLLLRSMGIPARYVEGYCVPPSLIYNGNPLMSEDYDDWYQGRNDISSYGVMNVEVSDAYAHAWVEIYLEDYGWVPYEFTPPSYETETEMGTSFFTNLFSGVFSTDIQGNSAAGSDINLPSDIDIPEANFTFSVSAVMFPVLLFFEVVLFIFIALTLIIIIRRNRQIEHLWKSENYNKLVSIYYSSFVKKLLRMKLVNEKNPLPRDCNSVLNVLLPTQAERNTGFIAFVERVCYSEKQPTKNEVKSFIKSCNSILKEIKEKRKKHN